MLVTCPYGLSSILNAELKRLGYSTFDTFDTGTYIDTDIGNKKNDIDGIRHIVSHLNTRSRVANKVYYPLVTQREVRDFDTLYTIIHSIDWSQFIDKYTGIVVKIHQRQSTLHAERTIQSIVHKAVITKLV